MSLPCESLATKAELEELRKQVNQLLGKQETGDPVNVLVNGNFDGTLIGDQLEFAENSVQDIKIQDINGANITAFDDNSLEKLAAGALTIVALKGKDLYIPLKILTKSIVVRASKIFAGIGIGKLAMAGGALTAMSASSMVSLLLIVASLAQSIATLQVLAARIDQGEKQAWAIDRHMQDHFNITAKNHAQIKKNEKIGQENKQNLIKNEETLKEIKQQKIDIDADILKNNEDIAAAEKMISDFKLEFEDYKAKVEAFKGETTEAIEKLKTNVAILEENLKISEENFERLKKTTIELGKQLAFAEGKITGLEIDLDRLKIQSTLNIADMITLKKDLSDHKIISKSKINGLRARLVLLEDNMSNLEDIDGGFPFLPFPVTKQLADTQNRTLVLANSLSSNPANTDDLVISPGTVLGENNFAKTFDQILQGINLGDLGTTDVNIPELAAQISNLVTPDITTNINTNLDTKFNDLGFPNLTKDIGDIKTNTSTPNLSKTVTDATTGAICNSSQGQGCLAQNIGKPITDSVKETAKTIGNVLDTLKELLDDETLERVKDIQEKINQEGENATLDKTILAATYLNSLHNAALLSTNVDSTMNWIASDAYEALKLKNYQGEPIEPQNWTKARLNEADQLAETTNKSKIEQENRLNKIAPVYPEWWQVRVGGGRPQLVIIFKPNDKNYPDQTSRWSTCIPHPNPELSASDFGKKIPSYIKGNVQGQITLPDNSKVIIYAKSPKEAESFLNTIISNKVINPQYLEKELPMKISNLNTNFKEVEVTPTLAKFFATGQKQLTPDWFESFDN